MSVSKEMYATNYIFGMKVAWLYVYLHAKVDEIAQAMTQNSFVTLTWFDEFLQWDPQEYGGIQTTELSNRQVWLPVRQHSVNNTIKIYSDKEKTVAKYLSIMQTENKHVKHGTHLFKLAAF